MEDGSTLLEHTLLTSGEIAESGGVYTGWPAHRLEDETYLRRRSSFMLLSNLKLGSRYRKLQRTHFDLEDEKRRLERKMEDHERELRAAKRHLDSMLRPAQTSRTSSYS